MILKFPQEKEPFQDFLDDLKKAYDEDRLNNFICIYDAEYKEGQEKDGFICGIDKYWFGNSSTTALGLCEIMKARILDFIAEKNLEQADDA